MRSTMLLSKSYCQKLHDFMSEHLSLTGSKKSITRLARLRAPGPTVHYYISTAIAVPAASARIRRLITLGKPSRLLRATSVSNLTGSVPNVRTSTRCAFRKTCDAAKSHKIGSGMLGEANPYVAEMALQQGAASSAGMNAN